MKSVVVRDAVQMPRLELKFKASPQPVLIQTSYFSGEPGANPSRDACKPVVAVYPDHYKWSRGPKALCGILIEAKICSLIDQPVALVPQATLSTIFNLLKKRDVIDATQWPNAIFGHDAFGRPQISVLFENKGTDQFPRPRLNQRLLPAGSVAIILDGRDISNQIDALEALLKDITVNSLAIATP